MSIVETERPMIINPDSKLKCDLLCELRCVYSKGNVSYVFDENGKLHFQFNGKDSVDVYYKNIPYQLKEIYIGKRRHKTYPEDPSIVGECTLFHVGQNENLIVSIFLRTTRGFSDSQDFFSQFLSKQVGTVNFDKTIDIDTDPSWSPQLVLPSKSDYYIYPCQDKKSHNIVYVKPVEIDADNFNKALLLQKKVLSERKQGGEDFLYYHPIESTVPSNSKSVKQKKCKPPSLFENIDPHCEISDSKNYNDSPAEWDGIKGYENMIQSTVVSIFLFMLAIGFFKGLPRLPTRTGSLILKFLGTLIWLPVHLSYIWFGQGSAAFIFFFVFIFGYLKEKFSQAKDKISGNQK